MSTRPPASAESGPRQGRWTIPVLVSVLAPAVPVLVAGVRAAARGWLPVGDDGLAATRAHDVFTRHHPLLGTWSSASQWAGRDINHPGPLQFEVLALPVRLFGPGAGTAIGTAATNAVCVVAAGLLAGRVAGRAGAAAVGATTAGLVLTMGSEILYDPWSQYAPLLPFLVVLVGAWAAVAGDPVGLVAAVVAGSFALQTHLSYALLVPGLGAVAVAGYLWTLRKAPDPAGESGGQRPERRSTGARRRLVALAGAAAVGLVLWAPPIVEQLTAEEGNASALAASAGEEAPPSPGLGDGFHATGSVVALPPLWLPPGWEDPTFDVAGEGLPRGLVLGALAAVAVALAGLGYRAWRRGDAATASGVVVALATIVLCGVSAARSTSPYGLYPTYLRWLWPTSAFTWSVLAVAVWREVAARGGALVPTDGRPRRAAAVAGLVAVVLAAAALPTRDAGTAARPWAVPLAQRVQDQALGELAAAAPVELRFGAGAAGGALGPPLMAALRDAGVDFSVAGEDLVRQMGEHRRPDGADRHVATLASGDQALETPPGSRRIAFSVGLDQEERARRGALRRNIESALERLGHIPLTELGRARLAQGFNPELGAEGDEAADLLASGLLRVLVDFALIEPDALSPDFDEWVDLQARWERETVALFLRPT